MVIQNIYLKSSSFILQLIWQTFTSLLRVSFRDFSLLALYKAFCKISLRSFCQLQSKTYLGLPHANGPYPQIYLTLWKCYFSSHSGVRNTTAFRFQVEPDHSQNILSVIPKAEHYQNLTCINLFFCQLNKVFFIGMLSASESICQPVGWGNTAQIGKMLKIHLQMPSCSWWLAEASGLQGMLSLRYGKGSSLWLWDTFGGQMNSKEDSVMLVISDQVLHATSQP